MPPVRAADCGDVGSMTGDRKPVVNCSADRAAPDRRLARAMMAGDQEDDAIAVGNRAIELPVDRAPCAIEGHSVQIDDAIGLDTAAAETLVPTAIERRANAATRRSRGRRRAWPFLDGDFPFRNQLRCL